jgi:hypothetical protein
VETTEDSGGDPFSFAPPPDEAPTRTKKKATKKAEAGDDLLSLGGLGAALPATSSPSKKKDATSWESF